MSLWSSIRTSLISKQLLRNYIDQFESLWTNLIIGIKLRDQNSYFVKEKKGISWKFYFTPFAMDVVLHCRG